ncbi:hypothetical protein OHA25_08675 [Nonomuraea sp. NBC_00507]|uniref:hypothetical protein n=1 Tax=Nonomuraea sp. NBC_00507 TaxID=2976002 RepID=UPI002E190173
MSLLETSIPLGRPQPGAVHRRADGTYAASILLGGCPWWAESRQELIDLGTVARQMLRRLDEAEADARYRGQLAESAELAEQRAEPRPYTAAAAARRAVAPPPPDIIAILNGPDAGPAEPRRPGAHARTDPPEASGPQGQVVPDPPAAAAS